MKIDDCETDNAAILRLPDWCDKEKQNRTISVDKCIVEVIKALWANRIETKGCCCGHNRERPSFIIADRHVGMTVVDALKIIAKVDSREWDIFQWRLVKLP